MAESPTKRGAGGPAPPDLPALETTSQEPLTMTPIRHVARDFKIQAAGE